MASTTLETIEEPPGFHTFCHISEYDKEGYRSLRQMVATSAPITLWSPSSSFFLDGTANISPVEFVNLIRDGAIRVVGREPWITDPGWRERMRTERGWPGFAWDDYIDGFILAIYWFDKDKALTDPNYQRRVMLAGPAAGAEQVQQIEDLLTPADRREIYDSFQSDDFRLPDGVKQAARQQNMTPETVVRSVLLDAMNHADAYRGTSARSPFFLDPPDSLFLRHLAPILAPGDPPVAHETDDLQREPAAEARRALEISRAVATQILDLLREMEDRTAKRTPNLTEFMKSPGRAALVSWYSDLHDEWQITADVSRLDGALLRRLQKVVDREPTASETFRKIFSDPVAVALNGLSIALDCIGLVSNPDPIAVTNMGIKGLSTGLSGLQMLNWIPRNYGARHWPFLYANGKPPNRRQQAEMRRVLEELAARRTIL